MKLEIITGQEEVEIENKFDDILYKNHIHDMKNATDYYIYFPEREIYHQKRLYETVREIVKEHIESDKDLFVLTYSDHVFNAVRVEIKKHKFEGAKCHQFLNGGVDLCADIDVNGRLTVWAEDIFDIWDQALIELL